VTAPAGVLPRRRAAAIALAIAAHGAPARAQGEPAPSAVSRSPATPLDAPSAPLLPGVAPLPAPSEILDPPRTFHVDAVTTRITSFDQFGHGYQAQGGRTVTDPGSERATIFEPQVEVDASQGARVKHRLWVPVDVVTNASADAIDVVTSASRHVESGAIDWTTTYKLDEASDVNVAAGLHLENPFRSWHGGLGASHAFADGDTVISASFLEVFDWFDRFDISGGRHGRADRSSATASLGVTQILTPTTMVNVNYGATVQRGELGNTWNSVPLSTFARGPEELPSERVRHAVVARAAQYLPWDGALHLYYRFYADDWGLVAHTAEAELMQRVASWLVVGAVYRFHTQNGVDFFSTLADPAAPLRTADSDLAPFDAHTIGGKVAIDVPLRGDLRALHLEVGYDRYFRTNDLQMNVVTCATGYRF
jgi:hypothetical protein